MTDTSMVDDEIFEAEAELPADEIGEDDALHISFEGDDEQQEDTSAPTWVKDLRVKTREQARRIAELEAQTNKAPEVGPKPTLENCDWDEEKYDTALIEWNESKRKVTETQTAAQRQAEQATQRFQNQLRDLAAKEQTLNAPDYKEARDEVVGSLSVAQQALLVKSSKDGAKVIYALGKHPERLAALSTIDDPVDFVLAVADLERSMKVTSRKAPPEPETRVRGSAPISRQSEDKVLAKMENDAARDPNYDRGKIVAYKKQMRERAGARR